MNHPLCLLLAMAGAGQAGDVRERPPRPQQSPREHPHGPPHLDHRRQAGGGQRQHTDGGEDHRQSHHLAGRQRRGDQQGTVDTGVCLCVHKRVKPPILKTIVRLFLNWTVCYKAEIGSKAKSGKSLATHTVNTTQ